jgi:hypothetical protein
MEILQTHVPTPIINPVMTKFEKILKHYLELKGVKVISLEHHPYTKQVILEAPNYSFHTVFTDVEKYFQIRLILIINIE